MPRVTFVKSARKANPVAEVGQSYYWWKFRFGGKRYSRVPPKPSQLTQSEYLSSIRGLIERCEHAQGRTVMVSDFEDMRDEIVSDVTELRDTCQDSLDNMPEGLQQAPTGELLQERIDALDSAESELENLEVEEPDDSLDDEEAELALNDAIDDALNEAIEALSNCDI